MALPPGPRLPKPVQTLLVWSRTIPFLAACRRRYGDCFTVRVAPMGRLVYLADPADIKRVFTGDPAVFHAGEGNALLGLVMGEHSLLLLDEDDHLRRRRLMLPPFHGESVRCYGEIMERVTRDELARWPLGRPFPLHPRMQAITLEVILRAVFGVEDRARLERLRALLPRVVGLEPHIMLAMFWRPLERVGPWRRYAALLAEVDELLYDEIARRRRDERLDERTDVLSLLIRARYDDGESLGDAELRDQLMTLLLAGHETTATALAWSFERLLRNPPALRRLLDELEAGGGDEYLDAVVRETLRVRPVIADVARRLTAETEVAGHRLPTGTYVMPAISLVQLASERYDDPERFRPERFLDGSPEPYTWIPFGGGPRRCLGAAFAIFEMKVVLRTVLTGARLRASRAEPERTKVRHVTHVPARGAEAVLEERATTRPSAPSPAGQARRAAPRGRRPRAARATSPPS